MFNPSSENGVLSAQLYQNLSKKDSRARYPPEALEIIEREERMTKIARMSSPDGDLCGSHRFLRSRVQFEEPPQNANMAKTLLESFRKHSERVLLVDVKSKREFTGANLEEVVGKIATALHERLNFLPGEVAFTSCDHSGPEILMVLGLVMAGGALYGSNINDGYSEERMLCKLVRPDLFVCQSRVHSDIMKLKRQLKDAEGIRIVWVDNPLKEETSSPSSSSSSSSSSNEEQDKKDHDEWREIIERDQVVLLDELMEGELNSQLIKDIVYRQIKPDKHALTYMLTSGSTGRPKVVRSTHEELMFGLYSMISATKYKPIHKISYEDYNNNNNNQVCSPAKSATSKSTSSQELLDPITAKSDYLFPISMDNVFSGDLPLDHGAGINTMFLSIYQGSKFIIMPSYQVDVFWQSVHDYRISSSVASTTFTYKLFARLKELIEKDEIDKWDLSCFRYIACCGSKMAFIDLVQEIKKVYTNINVCQCYGATEMGFMSMLPISDCETHLHSIGYLFPGMIAKVIQVDTERICGPNERGQLHIWSKSKFKQYMCHPDDDPNKMMERCHDANGFYMTGDLVHYDGRHRFYIHGRIKDTLYLMQDWKILPEELEDIVNEHPLVEYSIVVGIPDFDLPGCDAPRACVKLIEPLRSPKYNLLVDSQEDDMLKLVELLRFKEMDKIARHIYDFVAERTAKPKHLKGGVRILDEFPRVGLLNKIDRKALREME